MHLKIIQEIKELTVEAGESAMFECHITGPPDVDVDWLSNGKLIQPALLNCKMHFDGRRSVLSFVFNASNLISLVSSTFSTTCSFIYYYW